MFYGRQPSGWRLFLTRRCDFMPLLTSEASVQRGGMQRAHSIPARAA